MGRRSAARSSHFRHPPQRCLLALSLLLGTAAQPSELKLGIFMPWENAPFSMGPYISPAILIAVDDINNRRDILPDTTLKWVWQDDYFCNTTQANAAMLDMKLDFEVDAFVGPPCSGAVFAAAPVGRYWRTPFISYLAESPLLSDKTLYPNVARVNANDASGVVLVLDFARQQGWETLAVVYSEIENTAPTGDLMVSRIDATPDIARGFTMQFEETLAANANHTMRWMPELKVSGSRVVVVVGTCSDLRSVLLAADRLDMLEGYQYLLLLKGEVASCPVVEGGGWPRGWGPEVNDEAARAFNNTLVTAVEEYNSRETGALMGAVADGFARGTFEPYRFPPAGTIAPVNNVTQNPYGLPYSRQVESAALVFAFGEITRNLHDAIHLYARAAHAVIEDGKDPSRQPEEIARVLPRVNFTGVTGYIALDENLDRNPSLVLLQVRNAPDDRLSVTRVGAYDAKAKTYESDLGAVIYYPGGTTATPEAFVLRQCVSGDYEVSVADECNAAMDLPLRFTLKPGRECEDTDPEGNLTCAYVPAKSGPGVAVIVIASLAFLFAVAWAVWVLVYRKETTVNYAQPPFCLLFLAGCALLNVSSGLRIGRNVTVACVVSPCLFHLSFTLAFSALLAKCYRVWKIFVNNKLERRAVQASNVVQVCACLVLVDATVLTVLVVRQEIWFETTTEEVEGSSAEAEFDECTDAGALGYLLWVLKAFVMIATCALAWQMRDVDERFAESRHIMVAAYQATILCAIAGMVAITAESLSVEVLVQAFTTAIATSGAIVVIFGPKLAALRGWTSGDFGRDASRSSKPLSLAKSNSRAHLSEQRRGNSSSLGASQARRLSRAYKSRASSSKADSSMSPSPDEETAEWAAAMVYVKGAAHSGESPRSEGKGSRRVMAPSPKPSEPLEEGDAEGKTKM